MLFKIIIPLKPASYGFALFLSVLLISVSAASDTDKEIDILLRFIENSGCIFIRNNKEYSPCEARKHLEMKYRYVKDRIKTAESFIKDVATKSSISGKPYTVRCNGWEVSTSEWLNEVLLEYRKKQ